VVVVGRTSALPNDIAGEITKQANSANVGHGNRF
jgi:hypothetical protein